MFYQEEAYDASNPRRVKAWARFAFNPNKNFDIRVQEWNRPSHVGDCVGQVVVEGPAQKKLLNSGNTFLVEESPFDSFWG